MSLPPVSPVHWRQTYRIISSRFPPIDLFEDIADPRDWNLLIAATSKTNPRLAETIGHLDIVPVNRRVSGPGATYVMAPFTHISRDRPSRFSDGSYGVYYAGDQFEVALFETIFHFSKFMTCTNEAPGWASQFRELVGSIHKSLHDIRAVENAGTYLNADDYVASQRLAHTLRQADSDGIVYPSVRYPGGECIGAFFPDVISIPVQGRHLHYYWNGTTVDKFKNLTTGDVFSVG